MKKPDLFCMRPVERINRLGGGLQQSLAALFREISLGFRREMHIAHLARTENELLATALEDKLRFVFREHVRGAVETPSYSIRCLEAITQASPTGPITSRRAKCGSRSA